MLKEADAGMKVQDLCRKHNISDVTFYQWRSKYGGMEVPEAPLLKALVTDLSRQPVPEARGLKESGNARGQM